MQISPCQSVDQLYISTVTLLYIGPALNSVERILSSANIKVFYTALPINFTDNSLPINTKLTRRINQESTVFRANAVSCKSVRQDVFDASKGTQDMLYGPQNTFE